MAATVLDRCRVAPVKRLFSAEAAVAEKKGSGGG